MELVSDLSLFPAQCAVTARNDTQAERFIDTEASLKGQRVYLSESAIRPAASLLGFLAPDEAEELQRDLGDTYAANEALGNEVTQLRRELDAVHILRRRAFSAEQKRGPKARA